MACGKPFPLLVAVALPALVAVAASAADRLVPQQYPSIQAAINASAPGDTVVVAEGVFFEGSGVYNGNGYQVGLNIRQKNGLTIRGAGPSSTFVQLNSQYYGIMLDASSNVIIKDLAVINSYSNTWGAAHFFNGSSSCTLSRLFIRIPNPWHSVIDSYYQGNRLSFCTVIGEGADVLVDFAQLNVQFNIDNSVIVDVADLATGSLSVQVSNTCVWRVPDSSQASGSGNLFQDPIFVAPPIGDFRVTANTPCATASTLGGPIGALGAGEGDCDHDGTPDSSEIKAGEMDCDGDAFPDSCAISAGIAPDCDLDGVIDGCAIQSGAVVDFNLNGVPDRCECIADLFQDDQVNGADLGVLLSQWAQGAGASSDINRSGLVDATDLTILLGSWGPCP